MSDNHDKQSAIPGMDGPRALRPEEHRSALRLIDSAFRPEQPGAMEREYSLVLGMDNIENMRVIVKDGEVISHTAIYCSTLRSRESAARCRWTAASSRGSGERASTRLSWTRTR